MQVTLGGVLLTVKQSEINSWTESETTSNTFSSSFKASFDGIGGGGAYNHADKTGTTSSGSVGTDSLMFTAIGGSPTDANDFPTWAKSLDPVSAWSSSEISKMVPSLIPLLNMGSNSKSMLYYIRSLMSSEYANCPELERLQPIIAVGKYVSQIADLLPNWEVDDMKDQELKMVAGGNSDDSFPRVKEVRSDDSVGSVPPGKC